MSGVFKFKNNENDELDEKIVSELMIYAKDHETYFRDFSPFLKDQITGKAYELGISSDDIIGFMSGYMAAQKELK